MPLIPKLSIIIPVLNEQGNLKKLARHLSEEADFADIVVVDGGSTDNTIEVAESFANQVLRSEPGRAVQMNAGAKTSKGDYLLFLHADTQLPEDFKTLFTKWQRLSPSWGFFPARLTGSHWAFRIIERAMSFRSKISAIATGDQAICVQSDVFDMVNGYADIPLMEDVAISKQLARMYRPVMFSKPVLTSSRRWEHKGIWATVVLMWKIRFAYFRGASPDELAKLYRG